VGTARVKKGDWGGIIRGKAKASIGERSKAKKKSRPRRDNILNRENGLFTSKKIKNKNVPTLGVHDHENEDPDKNKM
jgi:hypothetical protein